ncbi:hypothetical protein ACFL08_00680 [Patescibacteria group bacterium]
MKTFIEIFDTILNANREESRKAAREVRNFLHSSRSGRNEFKSIKKIINSAPEKYSKIQEDWRQENFVVAVSVMYFLHDNEDQPDFMFHWLLNLLLHKNGNIRHAAVRMIEHEIGPLTYHIRFPEKKSSYHKFSSETADSIIFKLFLILHELISETWDKKYEKYKYIDSLPSSPYKSAQMILGSLEESCGDEYMRKIKSVLKGG